MKQFKYIMMALACILMMGCMDGDYDETEQAQPPYGDNTIVESNLVTIAQLKNMYKTQLSTDYRDGNSFAKVTKNLQIKELHKVQFVFQSVQNILTILSPIWKQDSKQ